MSEELLLKNLETLEDILSAVEREYVNRYASVWVPVRRVVQSSKGEPNTFGVGHLFIKVTYLRLTHFLLSEDEAKEASSKILDLWDRAFSKGVRRFFSDEGKVTAVAIYVPVPSVAEVMIFTKDSTYRMTTLTPTVKKHIINLMNNSIDLRIVTKNTSPEGRRLEIIYINNSNYVVGVGYFTSSLPILLVEKRIK